MTRRNLFESVRNKHVVSTIPDGVRHDRDNLKSRWRNVVWPKLKQLVDSMESYNKQQGITPRNVWFVVHKYRLVGSGDYDSKKFTGINYTKVYRLTVSQMELFLDAKDNKNSYDESFAIRNYVLIEWPSQLVTRHFFLAVDGLTSRRSGPRLQFSAPPGVNDLNCVTLETMNSFHTYLLDRWYTEKEWVLETAKLCQRMNDYDDKWFLFAIIKGFGALRLTTKTSDGWSLSTRGKTNHDDD